MRNRYRIILKSLIVVVIGLPHLIIQDFDERHLPHLSDSSDEELSILLTGHGRPPPASDLVRAPSSGSEAEQAWESVFRGLFPLGSGTRSPDPAQHPPPLTPPALLTRSARRTANRSAAAVCQFCGHAFAAVGSTGASGPTTQQTVRTQHMRRCHPGCGIPLDNVRCGGLLSKRIDHSHAIAKNVPI